MAELQAREILDKFEMMKQVVIGFTEVVEKENVALKNNDMKAIKALYEQKLKAIAAYRGAGR